MLTTKIWPKLIALSGRGNLAKRVFGQILRFSGCDFFTIKEIEIEEKLLKRKAICTQNQINSFIVWLFSRLLLNPFSSILRIAFPFSLIEFSRWKIIRKENRFIENNDEWTFLYSSETFSKTTNF